jgi:hypothetical protein
MNFAFVTTAVVFSSVATASVPAVRPITLAEAPAVIRVALPAGWGVVEAIRRVEHGGAVPASFEFTVRMRDGTTRTSSSASASKWRSGDRIMLIGGGAETPAAIQH